MVAGGRPAIVSTALLYQDDETVVFGTTTSGEPLVLSRRYESMHIRGLVGAIAECGGDGRPPKVQIVPRGATWWILLRPGDGWDAGGNVAEEPVWLREWVRQVWLLPNASLVLTQRVWCVYHERLQTWVVADTPLSQVIRRGEPVARGLAAVLLQTLLAVWGGA